jgi:tRNA A-37 threonylcarbamoyl transferase component Bud32
VTADPPYETTSELDDPELLPPGTAVGEYVLDELLGAGGFARVYRAHHAVLSAEVAIKVITRALALDADASARFVREARAASAIAHPGIVRVLGFGKLADGRAYQVMELIAGPALDDHLAEVGRLPRAEALRLLDAIAAALDAAHAAGIVHRDLKPANVLLAPGPSGPMPRLADFGIAKALEGETNPQLTRTGTTLGTPTYMSPEQALGRPVGPASDVYSFGVVAFELLTGEVPFPSESPLETMMHHVQTAAPAPSSVAPDLGPGFDAAMAALLAKRPEERPASAAAAMAALRAAGAVARRERGRARRWLAAGLGAGMLAGAAAIGLALLRGEGPARAATPAGVTIEEPGGAAAGTAAATVPAERAAAGNVAAPVAVAAGPDAAVAPADSDSAAARAATARPSRPAASAPRRSPEPSPAATPAPSPTPPPTSTSPPPAPPPADTLEIPPDYQP